MGNDTSKNEMPSWVLRATFTVIGAVLATYVGLVALGRLQDLVFWLITALFLSFALEPLVNRLEKRGWKRGLATGLILTGFVVLMLVFIGAMVPLVIDQIRELVKVAPDWVARISQLIKDWFGVEVTTKQLLDQIQKADISLGSTAGNVAGNIINLSGKIAGALFQFVTILLFTFYLVAEGPSIRRKVMALLPPRQQKQLLSTWEISIEKTGGYLYSRLLLAAISTAVTLVLLLIIGVPFALPLALFMGVISQFIPVIGTYIAASVPLLVALLENPWTALIFVIYVILYQQFENYVLSPRITAHTMQLHPAIAIVAALAGGSLYGAVGAFLALPLAAIMQASLGALLIRHDLIDAGGDLLGINESEEARLTGKKA